MIGFPLVINVIAVSERDMPGVEPGPLGWHTSSLTNELKEVRGYLFCVIIVHYFTKESLQGNNKYFP